MSASELTLLEQYKVYVEMADRVSSRRGQTNAFYVSLLTGLLAFLSVLIGADVVTKYIDILFLLASLLGLGLCFLWWVNIRSYRQLNSGKFKVVHEMETHLPFACYDREWEILGQGRNKKKYLQLTVVEGIVPLVMAVPYLILFVYSFFA